MFIIQDGILNKICPAHKSGDNQYTNQAITRENYLSTIPNKLIETN